MTEIDSIFNKINQVSTLQNETRFKILLALFNSDLTFEGLKIGTHSHTFNELQNIVGVNGEDLSYHLKILKSGELIDKDEKYYHISPTGKDILKLFHVDAKLVKEVGSKIKQPEQ